MAKVICIKNTIEFEDGDFITSDLVNVGEIYEIVNSEIIHHYTYELYESIEVYSNTTDDIWSCPMCFFMDLDYWRSQQIDRIIEPKDLS
jgi:hypothetical protein